MQYGFFDADKREYVITKPDTPQPWVNYLGSPVYGAIISNNAAGYSFVRSGADGRLIRYRFNELNTNLPGRYIYLRDDNTGDYWTNSWQPSAKSLDEFKSECRHGTAYTKIKSKYNGIISKVTYYVPLNCQREVWKVKVKNIGDTKRELSVFSYSEFTNLGNYEQDTVNLQYSMFISRTEYKDNAIVQHLNENTTYDDGKTFGSHRFLAAAGTDIIDCCGDREMFFGSYRNYGNPEAVEKGKAGGAHAYNGNAVGVLQTKIILEPGESKTFCYVLGEGGFDSAAEWVDYYADPEKSDAEIQELINYWHGKLDNLVVNTPDDAFNHEVNTWNAYQCFITFTWSRAASFIYCGQRNGYGYRDTVQDIQGVIHLAPDMAKELLKFMLSAQVSGGAGLPLVKYTHNAGHEDTPDDASYRLTTGSHDWRSDDVLWLFPTVDKYLRESGDIDFLDEVIVFAEEGGGAGTVIEHLKRALDFSYNNMTEYGLPAGLSADWNDCLQTGRSGVSSFVAFQLYYALGIFAEICKIKNNNEWHDWAIIKRADLGEAIDKYLKEPDRYLRAITENGLKIGSVESEEASVWLNAQSWAVISGKASGDYAQIILDTVNKNLNTKYGVKLFAPPFTKLGFPLARMILFNPGTKENAGIFSQSQGWIIQAEAKAGNGDRAFEYYTEANPCAYNNMAEMRRLEPYVHGQFIESDYSPYFGRANVHWLTGTASTMMIAAVEGILGIHPQYDGIEFDPCIPADWKGLTINKTFRGKKLNVGIINESGAQKGVKRVELNGVILEGSLIPFDKLGEDNEVKIYM